MLGYLLPSWSLRYRYSLPGLWPLQSMPPARRDSLAASSLSVTSRFGGRSMVKHPNARAPNCRPSPVLVRPHLLSTIEFDAHRQRSHPAALTICIARTTLAPVLTCSGVGATAWRQGPVAAFWFPEVAAELYIKLRLSAASTQHRIPSTLGGPIVNRMLILSRLPT